MGSILTNGVFLPAEGERNCYEGLAANWVAMDGLIGGYGAHAANLTIHVTAADKEAWNGKADASALTAHTGDTTIHVTAEDKATWNGKADASALTAHTGNTTIHVTAADKEAWNGKADDNSVVHRSGNETISGTKSFPDGIVANVTGSATSATYDGSGNVISSTYGKLGATNEWTGANIFQQNITYGRTNFYHQVANPCYILKDTELEKGSLATTHASYPGLWQDKNNNVLGYVRFVEYSSGRQTAEFRVSNLIKNGALDPTGSEVYCAVNLELQPSGEKSLIPEQNNDINLGTATKKWKSFNGLTPSSLGMPVIDRTKYVDISGYFTNTGNGDINTYSVTANGWVFLRLTDIDGCQLSILDSSNNRLYGSTSSGNLEQLCLPVTAGTVVETQWTTSTSVTVAIARFIPCQGNV